MPSTLFASVQCLLAALSPRKKLLVILFLDLVYYTSHLDIVSCPLVTLCAMIVTLVDSSFSFFLFLLIGCLCLFLSYVLTNEYIISIFICSCCKHIYLLANNKIIARLVLVMKIT